MKVIATKEEGFPPIKLELTIQSLDEYNVLVEMFSANITVPNALCITGRPKRIILSSIMQEVHEQLRKAKGKE